MTEMVNLILYLFYHNKKSSEVASGVQVSKDKVWTWKGQEKLIKEDL